MAAYAFNDALMKVVFEQLNLFQAIFLRGVCTVILLSLAILWKRGVVIKMSMKSRVLLVLRTIGEVGATICFLSALLRMPLANATAIMQSVPIGITFGAAVFLREPVGWRRWVSVSVGFFGVLLIIRPGMEAFNIWSLLVLAAVALIVLRDLITRKLTFEIPASHVSLLAAIMLPVVALSVLPISGWNTVTLIDFSMLAGAASILTFGYLFSVMAMRVGDVSFVSPFRYSIMLFAIFLGSVVFGEHPDIETIIGTLIIIAAGLYTVHREHGRHIK